jgi:hypothetical protein
MAKHRKTPARNSKGRFVKGGRGGGGGSVAIVRSAPRAVARRSPGSVVVVRAPATPAKRKARRGRRRHGGGSFAGGLVGALKSKGKHLGGSVVYGWITSGTGETAVKVREFVDKVPIVDAIGKPATHGLLLTFIATKTKGWARDIADSLGTAALHRTAYNFGANDFDMKKAAAVAGAPEDMSGDIDADESAGYDEELTGFDEDY